MSLFAISDGIFCLIAHHFPLFIFVHRKITLLRCPQYIKTLRHSVKSRCYVIVLPNFIILYRHWVTSMTYVSSEVIWSTALLKMGR